jgi:hypothetical protein
VSATVVLANIRRLAAHPSMQFGVRATFMPEHFGRQIEVLEFFRSLGVHYVCGAPAYSSTVNPNITVPVLQDFAHHFVPAFYHAQRAGMFYQTHLMVNFDEPVARYCRACTKPAHPQLTSDGYVSCCDWASFGPGYLPGLLHASTASGMPRPSGSSIFRRSKSASRSATSRLSGPAPARAARFSSTAPAAASAR